MANRARGGIIGAVIESQQDDVPAWRTLVLAMGAFALLSAVAAWRSSGFIEADGCTHYLYARFAFAEPHYLVNVWGRPLCTGIYAIPAAIGGRAGARWMSLALALVCAYSAYAIARGQGLKRPAVAAIFTLGMPLVFFHSFGVLTELPFAAVMGLAFWAYQSRRWGWLAILTGILPLGRPEGFGFLLLAGGALIVHRKGWWLAVLAAPVMGWDLAGWAMYGSAGPWWRWLIDNWPYSGDSLYGKGYLLRFVGVLPVLVSPLVFPFTLIGMGLGLSATGGVRGYWRAPHVRRCAVWIALLPLGVLVVHSLLHWLGKMASNGELRYLLVVAPLWGVLGAMGWDAAANRLGWRRPTAWAAAAVLAAGLVNWVWRVVPVTLDRSWDEARLIGEWYENGPMKRAYPHLMVAHPAVGYFLDINMDDRRIARPWTQETVAAAPAGTLLIWDRIYGVYNSSRDRSVSAEDLRAACWVEMPLPEGFTPADPTLWRIFRSPG